MTKHGPSDAGRGVGIVHEHGRGRRDVREPCAEVGVDRGVIVRPVDEQKSDPVTAPLRACLRAEATDLVHLVLEPVPGEVGLEALQGAATATPARVGVRVDCDQGGGLWLGAAEDDGRASAVAADLHDRVTGVDSRGRPVEHPRLALGQPPIDLAGAHPDIGEIAPHRRCASSPACSASTRAVSNVRGEKRRAAAASASGVVSIRSHRFIAARISSGS